MRRRVPWLIGGVVLAALGLYLVGNDAVALWDRDEPRYAQTSRQMLASGDWVVPRLLDEVRTAKPAFIYWCQTTAMAVFGDTRFAARFPSVVAMTLVLVVLAITLHRTVGPRRALWTVFVLATAGLTIAAAKMCLTDAVLLLWIVIAELALFAIYAGNRSWLTTLVLWLSIGLAGLTKGPVVLGVLLTTMLVLAVLDVFGRWRSPRAWREAIRWWPRTRPLVGIVLVGVVVAPWLWFIEQRQPGFLRQTLVHDVWTRSVKPLEGHKGPPGYYALTIWGTYFPWSLLLLTAITVGWRHRQLAPIRYALAAVIGPWVMFELVQTKLPHYILPAFPPLAFLTADALVRCARRQHDDLAVGRFMGMAIVWAVIVVALGLTPWAALASFTLSPAAIGAIAVFSLAAIAYAAVVARLFLRRRILPAAAAMGVGMIVLIAILYAGYFPRADFLRLSPRVADVLIRAGATEPGDVIAIGYKEDSLAFEQGGTLRYEGEHTFLATHPPDEWPQFVVIRGDVWDRMPPEVTGRLDVLARVEGIAYADDPWPIEVLVVRKRPGDDAPR